MQDGITEGPGWRAHRVGSGGGHGPVRRVAFMLATLLLVVLLLTSLYLVATRIASQNEAVARLDRMAAAKAADVATLRQDLEIRSRMSELDRWGMRMNLTAPQADQYALDGQSLRPAADARRRTLDALDVADGRAALRAQHPAYPAAARDRLDTLIDRVAP